MGTSKNTIKRWLDYGSIKGARWVIIATDTFDWEDYPVYVMEDEDFYEKLANHEKVMEVYDLNLDVEVQLAEMRAYHAPEREGQGGA